MSIPFSRFTLATRLMVAAVLSSTLILLVAGFVLSTLYVQSAEKALDERLQVYIQGLVGDLSGTGEGDELEVESYGETKFDVYLSGWYWQIERLDEGNQYRLTSRSLGTTTLPVEVRSALVREGRYASGPDQQTIRLAERLIEEGENGRYRIMVAMNADELKTDIFNFNLALMIAFGVLAAALALVAVAQVRFGLTPLKALQNAIGAVREGKTHTITGAYPPDLSPLANELNLLLEANRAILERARTQAGNLAHALKTPLSVIVNEAEREQSLLAHTVLEQAQAMNTQITASLNRARMAAIAGEDGALAVPLGTRSHVNEALAHLINMFAKVYRERNLDFEMHVPDEVYVRVEKQDLDDILANLIDNACKWAKTRVVVTVQRKSDLETSHWDITIDDDGEGLSSDQCQTALKRGQRLDTRQNGSGLGLSIVQDLVSLYAGALTLEQSPQGGLRACVVLASSE